MDPKEKNKWQIEGIIKKKWDASTEKIKRTDLMVTYDENGYIRDAHIQMLGKRADMADQFNEGDKVGVLFNVQSAEKTNNVIFTNIIGWFIKRIGS
jgi:hypothetical protein